MSLDQTIPFLAAVQHLIPDANISMTLTMRVPKQTNKSKQTVWAKQHDKFTNYIREMTQRYLLYVWRVYEVTCKGYLHVHAIAKANPTILKETIQLLNMQAECHGFYQRDIFYIKDFENWSRYCCKEIASTQNIFQEMEFPFTVTRMYKPRSIQTPSEPEPSKTPQFPSVDLDN